MTNLNLNNLVFTIMDYLHNVGEAEVLINGESHHFYVNDSGNLFLGYDTFVSLENSPELAEEVLYEYIKGLNKREALIKDLPKGTKLSLHNGEWRIVTPLGEEFLCYSMDVVAHLLEGMAIPF